MTKSGDLRNLVDRIFSVIKRWGEPVRRSLMVIASADMRTTVLAPSYPAPVAGDFSRGRTP